jgi:hypothetical protein
MLKHLNQGRSGRIGIDGHVGTVPRPLRAIKGTYAGPNSAGHIRRQGRVEPPIFRIKDRGPGLAVLVFRAAQGPITTADVPGHTNMYE